MNLKPILYGIVILLAVVFVVKLGGLITGYAAGTSESVPGQLSITSQAPTIGTISCSFTQAPGACSNGTVECVANVTDSNGYTNFDGGGRSAGLYISPKDQSTCQADTDTEVNSCYFNDTCSLTQVNVTTGTMKCTFPAFRFYANPGNWNVTFNVIDEDNLNTVREEPNALTVSSLSALDVINSSINFGTVAAGSYSNNLTIHVQNCGNVQIDLKINGTDMTNTSATDGLTVIKSENITFGLTMTSITTPLNATQQLLDVNSPKPTSDTAVINYTYWRMYVPFGASGSYSNTIQFTALQG